MNSSVTYISDESILKRLYMPCAITFTGFTLTYLSITSQYHHAPILVLIGIPILILAGIWGIISALISPFLKLPRLTLTKDGIKLERLLSTWFIAWQDLGPFEYEFGYDIKAKIISGQYKKKEKLVIPPLNVDKLTLFKELNKWREKVQ